jgi:hypothetical protein
MTLPCRTWPRSASENSTTGAAIEATVSRPRPTAGISVKPEVRRMATRDMDGYRPAAPQQK